jgi:hypothetical protein
MDHIPAVQLNNNLARAVVVNLLELSNVAWLPTVSCMLREYKRINIMVKVRETCKISAVSIYRQVIGAEVVVRKRPSP